MPITSALLPEPHRLQLPPAVHQVSSLRCETNSLLQKPIRNSRSSAAYRLVRKRSPTYFLLESHKLIFRCIFRVRFQQSHATEAVGLWPRHSERLPPTKSFLRHPHDPPLDFSNHSLPNRPPTLRTLTTHQRQWSPSPYRRTHLGFPSMPADSSSPRPTHCPPSPHALGPRPSGRTSTIPRSRYCECRQASLAIHTLSTSMTRRSLTRSPSISPPRWVSKLRRSRGASPDGSTHSRSTDLAIPLASRPGEKT